MHLKSSIHQKYKTTLDHVLAHNHHNSSELIRQHVQHYANSNHTISQYVSIMQSHHYTNFNREWQLVKQEIQILEQHLNKFTKTTWSHPELFDDVQFLSATLLQSAGMFQTFVQDVLKSMQYRYAKQWFVATNVNTRTNKKEWCFVGCPFLVEYWKVREKCKNTTKMKPLQD